MALPAFPTTEVAFLAELNGDIWDASANPYGMDDGGHIPNWPIAMNYMATITNYSAEMGDFLVALAEQVSLDAASAAAGSGTEASVENIRSGTSAEYLSIRRTWAAAAPVALVDAATIAVDMATGINFSVTLGGDRQLGNPTNATQGQSGLIIVTQDATGGRDLTKASNWKVAGGTIVIDLAPSAKSVLSYYVESETSILLTVSESFA